MSDHDSLFTSFTDLVNRFTHHRGQIAKAEALSDRFRAEVIGVVVDDHTSRSMDLVGDIMASLLAPMGPSPVDTIVIFLVFNMGVLTSLATSGNT